MQLLTKPWLYLIIVLASFGMKCLTIDNRHYWRDEIYTIYHTTGDTELSLDAKITKNEIHNIAYFKKFLIKDPKTLSLSNQYVQMWQMVNLNPLHYYVLGVWQRIVGHNYVHYRYFSLLLFVLCLPVLFLLAKGLFKSNLAGWMAISLFSMSPYFHIYAHEARYNMLLCFIILCLHSFLLLALKTNKLKYWIGYGLFGICTLYASLTAGVILFGHFLYVLLFKRNTLKPYVTTGVCILAGFAPWGIKIYNHSSGITNALSWQTHFFELSPFSLLANQLMNFSRTFAIFSLTGEWITNYFTHSFEGINLVQLIVNILVLIIIAWAFFLLYKKVTRDTFWFIIFITFPLTAFFYTQDIIRGAMASVVARYQLGTYLGVLLLMSFFFTNGIKTKKLPTTLIFFVFIGLGIASLNIIRLDWRSYTVTPKYKHAATAKYLNSQDNILIITDGTNPHHFWGDFLSIVNKIETNNIDVLYVDDSIQGVQNIIQKTNKSYKKVLFTMMSDKLKENMQTQFEGNWKKIEAIEINDSWEKL